MPLATPRDSRALVVDAQDWVAPSVDAILSPCGFHVTRACSGAEALKRAVELQPDVVLVDSQLPDMGVRELCSRLAGEGTRPSSVPVVVLATEPVSADDRTAALRGGAWDVMAVPLVREELVLKVSTWVAARRGTPKATEDGLVDEPTGFYNTTGLLKRLSEISADAARYHRPLACVVLGPLHRENGSGQGQAPDTEVPQTVVDGLGVAVRASDTIGVLADGSLAVVAPGTDRDGARILAQRLVRSTATGRWSTVGTPVTAHPVRAGFCAVSDAEASALGGLDLLARATHALQHAHSRPHEAVVHASDA